MSKVYVILMILLLLVITSCEQEEPEIIIEECESNQIEVDEECITLTGPEMQLYNTFSTMKEVTNYQMNIVIQDGETSHDVILQFTNDVSTYQDANETIYYIHDGNTCEQITDTLNIITTETISCDSLQSGYPLFQSFEYTWFALVDGVFQLQETAFSYVEPFFTSMIPNSELVLLTIQIASNEIQYIHAEITINDLPYLLDFSIHSIGSVSITLPQE